MQTIHVFRCFVWVFFFPAVQKDMKDTFTIRDCLSCC